MPCTPAVGVISGVCDSVCARCVYICVRAVKRKRLELSTQSLVHVQSTAAVLRKLDQKVKVKRLYENGHGRAVTTEVFCRGCSAAAAGVDKAVKGGRRSLAASVYITAPMSGGAAATRS